MNILDILAVGLRAAKLFTFQVTYVTLLGTAMKKEEKQTERPEGVFSLAGSNVQNYLRVGKER